MKKQDVVITDEVDKLIVLTIKSTYFADTLLQIAA
jgi:hypothetical protein